MHDPNLDQQPAATSGSGRSPGLRDVLLSPEFSADLLLSAGAFLLLRIGTTFALAFLYGESWSVHMFGGILPVIAFEADANEYAEINTYSTLLTCAFVGFIGWRSSWRLGRWIRGSDPVERTNDDWLSEMRRRLFSSVAWLCVSIVSAGQLLAIAVVNSWQEIEFNLILTLPIIGLAAISALILAYRREMHTDLLIMLFDRGHLGD